MVPVVLLIFFIPLGLAGSFIFRGLRGIRVGDHPVCRRCGFDLFGQPAGTAVCGECGTSLRVSGSVAVGHHQRRSSFIVAGLVIGVPILFVAGLMLWGEINSTNWMSYAPTRFVVWRAESSNKPARTAAFAELNSRLSAGTLGSSDLIHVADTALAYQADLSKPWDPAWGDLLEGLQANGKLSNERWKQYLTQASQGAFDLRLRKQVRHGEGLPWEIERVAIRSGTGSKLQISFDPSPMEWLSPHGLPTRMPIVYPMQTSLNASGGMAQPKKLQASDFPEPLPNGVQQVRVHGTVKVGFPGTSWRINPVVSSEIDLPGTFTLMPANTPVETDPQEALHTDQLRKSLSLDVSFSSRPLPGLSVMVTPHESPIAFDVNVLARTGGHELSIGGFGSPAQLPGSIPCGTVVESNWPTGKPATVDIIIRSNPDFIIPASWNTDEIWTGEIVFKDVPVK